MIASLPMYEYEDTVRANDRFWALIRDGLRARGVAAPDALGRGAGELLPHWLAPDLVLSQTCGFPYRAALHGQVTLVGTPDFGLAGCAPGYYRSVFVARADDARDTLPAFDGAHIAYNDPMSQSGWAAPQAHAAKLGLRLAPGPCTGAHRLSALAVLEGRADLAAIDAVTWLLLCRNQPRMAGLKPVVQTDPTPGLPYIAARGADGAATFDAIAAAIAALSAADRDTLHLRGIVRIPPESYLAVPTPPSPDQIAQEN